MTLSSSNVDAELAGIMDTSIGHTDGRVAALEKGLESAVAATQHLSDMFKATSSTVGSRMGELDPELSTLKAIVSSTVSVSPQK